VSSIKYMLIILLSIMLFISCSDKGDVPKARVANIIRDIEHSFNNTVMGGSDVSSIMKYYHDDYSHNGAVKAIAQAKWSERADLYDGMKAEIIRISIDGDYGIATLKITFYLRGGETVPPYTDPDTFGDMSYFIEQDKVWKIWGKDWFPTNDE